MNILRLTMLSVFLQGCSLSDGKTHKAKEPTEPAPFELKPSSPVFSFNLFARGNANLNDSSVQGKAAILGSASLTDYSIGQVMPPDENRCDLSVGQDLSFMRGSVYQGKICVAGKYLSEDLGTTFPGSDKIDSTLNQIDASTETLSSKLKNIIALQTVSQKSMNGKKGGVKIVLPTEEKLFAIQVEASADKLIQGLEIQGSVESSLILNFSGKSWDLTRVGVNLSGIKDTNVIYNFSDATSILMENTTLQGTLLAPFAKVSFTKSSVIGSVICKDIKGDGRFILKPYIGELSQ